MNHGWLILSTPLVLLLWLKGCKLVGVWNLSSSQLPFSPTFAFQLPWFWVSSSLWVSRDRCFVGCLPVWPVHWCCGPWFACLASPWCLDFPSCPWGVPTCFFTSWDPFESAFCLLAWAATPPDKTANQLSFRFQSVAWRSLFVVLLGVLLRPCLLSQDPLLGFQPLLLHQSILLRWCLNLTLLPVIVHQCLKPETRFRLLLLLALAIGFLKPVVWVVLLTQSVLVSNVLGWRVSGLVQCLTVVPGRRTVRSPWIFVPGSTLSYVVILCLALWCSVLHPATGVPSVPFQVQVPIQSAIPSLVRSRPRCTWLQPDSASLSHSLIDCRSHVRSSSFRVNPSFTGRFDFGRSRRGALCAHLERTGARDRWSEGIKSPCPDASRRRRTAGCSRGLSSRPGVGSSECWNGFRHHWTFKGVRGSLNDFGRRTFASNWNHRALRSGRLSSSRCRFAPFPQCFRRDSFCFRRGVPVCSSRPFSFDAFSSRMDSRTWQGIRLRFLLCSARPDRSRANWFAKDHTKATKSSSRYWFTRRKSKREDSKETLHGNSFGVSRDFDSDNPRYFRSAPSPCGPPEDVRGACDARRLSFFPCTSSTPFQSFAGSEFGGISRRERNWDSTSDPPEDKPWFVALPCFDSTSGTFGIGEGKAFICGDDPWRYFGTGRPGPIKCLESACGPDCSVKFRSSCGLGRNQQCRDSRIGRTSSPSSGTCCSERDFLSGCPSVHGSKNVPDCSCGWFTSTTSGSGHLWDPLLGEVRRLRKASRPGDAAVPGHEHYGLSPVRQCSSGSGCSGSAQCDPGTGGVRWGPIRAGCSSLPPRRLALQHLCEPPGGSSEPLTKFCASGFPDLDHHRSCLPQGVGHHPDKEIGVGRHKELSIRSRQATKSKACPKAERRKRKRSEAATGSGCRGNLDCEGPRQEVCSDIPINLFGLSMDFETWCHCLPRWIFATRTKFSWSLFRSFRAKRHGSALSTTVFPLPSPSLEVFARLCGPGLSKQKARRLAVARVEHILVFILDYLFLGRFPSLAEIGRPANAAQTSVFRRLRSAIAVCGMSEEKFPLCPGRSGPELAASLMQLEHFVSGCPEFKDVYSKLPDRTFRPDPELLPRDKYPELVPHRNLDSSRIKITGEGRWPMEKFISNSLWLPFQEPAFLCHGLPIEGASLPDFRYESKAECLKLAKLWDVQGMLELFPSPLKPGYFSRVFQVYKSAERDRQIGDRRLPNASEYHISGPSRQLPPGQLLCQIHVPRDGYKVVGSVTDRRDFYHQAAVTSERARTNMLPFSYGFKELGGLAAFSNWTSQKKTRHHGLDRTQVGDQFGIESPAKRGVLVEELYPSFKSLFQGDHLGVEFALSSHESLLVDEGLLWPSRRLLGHSPVPDSDRFEGLIIDDYFAIGIEPRNSKAHDTFAFSALAQAREAYQKHALLGSVEKDVVCETSFKAAGAEINSSEAALCHRLISVGPPWQKRFGVSVVSLRAARLPWITKQLAVRLSGNWVSMLLFRRCLVSIVDSFFALGAQCESNLGQPDVVPLSRKCAQELAMLAAIAPLIFTNIAVDFDHRLFASDSSSKAGAFTIAKVSDEETRILWRYADKKGGYTKLESPVRAILKELLPETELAEEQLATGPFKAPLLSFDFIEFYGGAGVISKHMLDLGFTVAPPLDLSLSPHYDMSNVRLLEWCIHMLENDLIKSFMCEPPCTSFSPAAHPSVRSYAEPLGYDRSEPKTFHGNLHAFRSLTLLRVGKRRRKPCGLEQPRLSKMGWLTFWRSLLSMGFAEAIVAACQFGSIHKKEFKFLLHLVDETFVETRCPGGHRHVRIEGKWTKGSAVYPDALGHHLALAFARALRIHSSNPDDVDLAGFESPLVNDMMETCKWTLGRVWEWKKAAHINVYETDASVAALMKASSSSPHSRHCFAVDSLVARGALSKGRSSSRKLQPSLRRSCSIQIAFDSYPAWIYAPTRLNVPDDPTRDLPLRKPVMNSFRSHLSKDELELLHSSTLRRFAANWCRFVILISSLQSGAFGSKISSEKPLIPVGTTCAKPWFLPMDFVGYGFWTQPMDFVGNGFWTLPMDFVGPRMDFAPHFLCVLFASLSLLCLLLCLSSPLVRLGPVAGRSPIGRILGFCLVVAAQFVGSHGVIGPANAEERRRANERGDLFLPADRLMRAQTRNSRKILVSRFRRWLWSEHKVSLYGLLQQKPPDPEMISNWLAEYGRDLFKSGKSYGQYSETINGIAMMKPIVKKQLVTAWDVAFAWLVDEPHQHHPALPLSVLLAMLSVALAWGWAYEAAVISMSWAGLLRIGEVLQSKRADLVLPGDSAPGVSFALLKIQEPKTRGRHARHQAARVDQSDIVSLLNAVYGPMAPHEALWPFSAATLRKRFNALLNAVGLPCEKRDGKLPFSLGSLRPGGATFLLQACENSELVRRRGRWLSTRVMEIYLQEVLVVTFVRKLEPAVRAKLEALALGFESILQIAIRFLDTGVPTQTWHWLMKGEAGLKESDAGMKWQCFSDDCPNKWTAWHHRAQGLAEKGRALDPKHSTGSPAAAQGPTRPTHCSPSPAWPLLFLLAVFFRWLSKQVDSLASSSSRLGRKRQSAYKTKKQFSFRGD